MEYILDIGAYQIVTRAHEERWKQLKLIQSKTNRMIILCIGSSNKSNQTDDPLDAVVREALVRVTLTGLGLDDYLLVHIPDIGNTKEYANHVKRIIKNELQIEINEQNTILYTKNDWTISCFQGFGHNFKVIRPDPVRMYDLGLGGGDELHATYVRQVIRNGDDFSGLVPQATLPLYDKFNIIDRVKSSN